MRIPGKATPARQNPFAFAFTLDKIKPNQEDLIEVLMFENVKRYFDENVLREYLEYVQQRKINKIGFSKDLR
ncbi:MAG: hypothetical protein WA913_16510, partial [Pricia sp.]